MRAMDGTPFLETVLQGPGRLILNIFWIDEVEAVLQPWYIGSES